MKRASGFTLIEVLIAITITALLGTGAFTLLNQSLRNKAVLEEKSAMLEQVQKIDRLLAADFSQVVDRPVRDGYGMRLPSLTTANTANLVELTRTGWRDAATLLQELVTEDDQAIPRRSSLQRIAYRLEDEVLYRDYWRVLDRAQDTQPVTLKLLTGVRQFKIRFLDSSNNWTEEWPVLSAGVGEAPPSALPKGVEIVYEPGTLGEVRRVFPIASEVPPVNGRSANGGGTGGLNGNGNGGDLNGGNLNGDASSELNGGAVQ